MTQQSRHAAELFEYAIAWLRDHYDTFGFSVKRDVVWTVQSWLRRVIQQQDLEYAVFNDYPMLPGPRRSRSADLVIRAADGAGLVAAEFKYEPAHGRPDILPQKLPVVFWGAEGVTKDVMRIREFVEAGTVAVAYAVFIDEGGYFRHREPPVGSAWIDWHSGSPDGYPVSVLWSRWPS